MNTLFDFEIIIGTYQEFLLGYLCSVKGEEVKQSFALHDHLSSVRTLACSGNYIASGGADDRIIIYDLKTRKECHRLMHNQSTITCLQFTVQHSHLITGSSDGVLAITRVGNWQTEKKWDKAHKGKPVMDIAVHPSGKLALSIGGDTTLRTWNLVKGRQAFAINLNSKSQDAKSLEHIIWGPDEVHFILYGGKNTEVWSIEEGGISKSLSYDKKVTSCIWINTKKILVGHEDGCLTLVKLKNLVKKSFQAHDTRIKSLVNYNNWIISISSDGEFKIWSEKLEELLKKNTGCRLTCLCVAPVLKIKEEEPIVEEEVEKTDINITKQSRVIITEENCEDEIQLNNIQPKHKKRRKLK